MRNLKNPLLNVIIIYFICYVFRFIEYFFIQTDRTFWGEAFLHKVMEIVVLYMAANFVSLKLREIGFAKNRILVRTLLGLAFGAAVFVIAYGVGSIDYFVIRQLSGITALCQQLYHGG